MSKTQWKRSIVESIDARGPMADGQAVMKAFHDAGFRGVRTGPEITKASFPSTTDRYMFIMEREIIAAPMKPREIEEFMAGGGI